MTKPLFVLLSAMLSLGTAHAHQKTHATPDVAKIVETEFGRSGSPAQVTQTLHVSMRDTLRFEPEAITVRQGETVRLVVHNAGAQMHELVLGTPEALQQHAELMKKFPGMEHDEPYMAHVSPGHKGEIVWQFTQPGRYQFACLLPGHYEGGMVGAITVLAAAATSDEHAQHHDSGTDTTEGEVRRINREQNKITLRHGPLKALDMPAMTMVFVVSEPRLLDGLKVGDNVRFTVQQNADGSFVVTQIQPAP